MSDLKKTSPFSGSPFLSLEVVEQDGTVSVTPRGEIDMSNIEELRAVLVAQQIPGRHVRLDLSQLDFMDSTGIRLLLEADAAARADGHSLSITGISQPVRRVLEISGVLDRLPIVTDGGSTEDSAP